MRMNSTIVRPAPGSLSRRHHRFPAPRRRESVLRALAAAGFFLAIGFATLPGALGQSNCVVVSCPGNITACCAGNATNGTVVTYSVTASNVCAGTNLTASCLPPSGSQFFPGIRTVNCSATAGGQTNTCSFTVTITGACLPGGSPQILFDSLTNTHSTFATISSNLTLAIGFLVANTGDYRLSSATFPLDAAGNGSVPVEVALLDSTGGIGADPGLVLDTATTVVSNTVAFRTFVFPTSPFVRAGKRYWLRLRAPASARLYGRGQYVASGLSFAGDNYSLDRGTTWQGSYGFNWEARIQGWSAAACVRLDGSSNLVAACNGGSSVPVSYTVRGTNRCAPADLAVQCSPPSGSSFPPGVWPVVCQAASLCEIDRAIFTVTVPDDNCSPPACAPARLFDDLIYPPNANADFPIANNQWLGLAFRSTNSTLLSCINLTLRRDELSCTQAAPVIRLRQSVLTTNGLLPGAVLQTLPAFTLTTAATVATNCAFPLNPPVTLAAGGIYFVTWETAMSTNATCYKAAARGPGPSPNGYLETGIGYVGLARSSLQDAGWAAYALSGTTKFGLRLEGQPCSLTLNCPNNLLLPATAPDGASVDYLVFATNGCTGQPVGVACTPASGSLFPIGTNTVFCQAGANGVTNQCSFVVVVTPPECCENKEWVQAQVGGPKPRSGHVLVSDPTPGRLLLFGGREEALRGDTWIWDGTGWSSPILAGPSARELAAAALDSRRGRVVLFGGSDGTNALGDTWEWDGGSWSTRNVGGPPARHSHGMAYDPVRQRVVLSGGQGATDPLNDTWEYDGTNWTLAATSGPGPVLGHALAWDGTNVITFGGSSGSSGSGLTGFRSGTWAWNGSAWTSVATNGPGVRQYHSMALDDSCGRVVLFGGGLTASNVLSDTWEWDRTRWTLRPSGGPPARWRQGLAHDRIANRSVLFGGTTASSRLGDTWRRVPDRTAPALISADAVCGKSQVCATFSEGVSAISATNPANYRLANGPAVLTARLNGTDPRSVCLTLAQPVSSGTPNTLLTSNLTDTCGNTGSSSIAFTCQPCATGSAGTGFWLAFPGNYPPEFTNEPAPQLFVTGAAGVSGTVSAPGLNPPFTTNFTIPPNNAAIIYLPRDADLSTNSDIVTPQGVRLDATASVSVYGYNRVPHSTDGYLALPTNALGRVHRVLTFSNTVAGVPELAGVQLVVAGTEDGTRVTIVPSVPVGSHAAGDSILVVLNAGDTYQLRNTNDAPSDLTGTLIAADHPVAVFGSHACATAPSGLQFFCNHLVEQLPPAEAWGTEFVTVPLANRINGDTFRVLALADDTSVWTNGVLAAAGLGAGQFHQSILTNTTHLVSDKPVLVAQFAHSSTYDRVRKADPTMILVPPTRLYDSHYEIATPVADFPTNHLNLMVPAGAVGQVLLDGVAIPAGGFHPVGASGYYALQKHLAPSAATMHRLTTANGHAFGVIAYGWSDTDAYGYPGGLCIPTPPPAPVFTCPPEQSLAYANPDDQAAVPDFRPAVGHGTAALQITQEPPPGTSVGLGSHDIVVTVYDAAGGSTRCTTTFVVVESPPAFNAFGLDHRALGSGIPLVANQQVVTSGIGSSGQDGVSIDLGRAEFGQLVLESPDPARLPNGASVAVRALGSLNGLSDQTVAEGSLVVDDGGLRCRAVFPGMDRPPLLAMAFDSNRVVAVARGLVDVFARITGPPGNIRMIPYLPVEGSPCLVLEWPDARPVITLPGRPPIAAQRVVVTPDVTALAPPEVPLNVSNRVLGSALDFWWRPRGVSGAAVDHAAPPGHVLLGPISRLDVVAASVPSVTILDEAVGQFGVAHRGIGATGIQAQDDPAEVVVLPDAFSLARVDLLAGDSPDWGYGDPPVPVGLSQQFLVVGDAVGAVLRAGLIAPTFPPHPTNDFVASLEARVIAPGTLAVTPNFAPLGLGALTAEIWSNGVPVRSLAAGNTAVATVSAWPHRFVSSPVAGASFLAFGWPSNIVFNFGNGVLVTGNELHIGHDAAALAFTAARAASLRAGGLARLRLIDESVAPAGFPFQGRAHRPVGFATLATPAGPDSDLVVSNLTANSSFGVSASPGQVGFVTARWAGFNDADPDGALVEASTFGTLDGIPGQYLGTVRATKDGRDILFSTDRSPLGTGPLLVSVFDHAQLAGVAARMPTGAMVRALGPGLDACSLTPTAPRHPGSIATLIEFPAAVTLVLPDGSTTRGTRIVFDEFDPEHTNHTEVSSVSRSDIRGAGLTAFRLKAEQSGAYRQAHQALGQARLLGVGTWLRLDHLVSAGSNPDGVAFPASGHDDTLVYWRQPNRFGETPPGAFLQAGLQPEESSAGPWPIPWFQVTGRDAGVTIAADLSPVGATSRRVDILHSNAVVFTTTLGAATGPVAQAAHWPAGFRGGNEPSLPGSLAGSWRWIAPEEFTIGGQTIAGDQLRVSAVPALGNIRPWTLRLLAAGLPKLELAHETASTPAPIRTRITVLPGGTLVVWWDSSNPGQVLQIADDPGGPWSDIPGATASPYLLQPAGTKGFLRVAERPPPLP